MKITKEPPVSIITPTTGRPELKRCIQSILNQTHRNVQHFIVVDGAQYKRRAKRIVASFEKSDQKRIDMVCLPYTTGAWGGRIYASAPVLTKGDYITHCDDDNWFEKEHVESLLTCIGKNEWAYSLRTIVYAGHKMRDCCESLGFLHRAWNLKSYFIDTNCCFFTRKVALETAPYWYNPKRERENDRLAYKILRKKFPNYTCSMKHTLNYEITPRSATSIKFFINGNKWMVERYKNIMPWEKNLKKDPQKKQKIMVQT